MSISFPEPLEPQAPEFEGPVRDPGVPFWQQLGMVPTGDGTKSFTQAPAVEARENAIDIFRKFFESLGIKFDREIESVILDAMRSGITPDQMDLIIPDLQNTSAFKARFPGWEQRKANGFNAISLGEYIQMEDAYRSILAQSGLPKGFYDDNADLGRFIAMNISAEELQTRVDISVDAVRQVDPTMRNLLTRYYGVGRGDIAAYFLDPKRAQTLIEHQYETAGVASWAQRAGLDVSDRTRFEQLVAEGVTTDQAAQSYGTIAALTDTVGRAASVYGEAYDQRDAEQDVFFNETERRQRIMRLEQGTFGGSSAGATGSGRRQSY